MTRFYHKAGRLHRTSSANHFNIKLISCLAGALALAMSCKEDPTKIGIGLLPPSDFVSTASTDTMSVRSFTMYTSSVESDKPQVSYLGSLYDPYFGSTYGELVSQVRLSASWNYSNVVNTDSLSVDSVRLYLKLLSVKGTVNQPVKLRISEIDQQLYDSLAYYSDQVVPLTGYSWSVPLPALKPDTVNSIVVNIPRSFGARVIRDTSKLFLSNKVPDFRSYFKGIYFQLESAQPVLTTLSVAPSQTSYSNYIYIYMHDQVGSAVTPYMLLLDAVVRNAAFNIYKHDFSTADPLKKIKHINDTTVLDSMTYAQRLNGVYTRIVIPGLRSMKNNPEMKKIGINKARLIFPDFYDGSIYKPGTMPGQVFMRYDSIAGKKYWVPDYDKVSPVFFDGTPDTVKNVFKVNIATYVQKYLEDKSGILKPELDLYLPISSTNNLILKANKSHTPVKFELTWTKF